METFAIHFANVSLSLENFEQIVWDSLEID